MFENAIKGGRIDGVFDMKVLRAYLEHYFSKDVISGKIALPVGFVLPNTANIKDYVVLINKMNEEDNPS